MLKITILILEAEEIVAQLMQTLFGKKFNLILGKSLEEAEKLFLKNKASVDAVIVDGALWSHDCLDSGPFLELLKRENFKGPIVANSARYNSQMLKLGATHLANDKLEAIEVAVWALCEMKKSS